MRLNIPPNGNDIFIQGLGVLNYGIIYIKVIGRVTLEAVEVARKAVEAASEKQATNIVLLDAREVCSFADYFVICSGDSEKQIKAIYDEIEKALKQEKVLPYHCEGSMDSGWLLLDFSDVIVHIFAPFEREYYQLDELWSKAVPLVRIQ